VPGRGRGRIAVSGGLPPTVVTSALVLLGLALWLALPSVVLANNCPSLASDEIGDCIKKTFDASLFLIGFALGAMGGALLQRQTFRRRPRPEEDEESGGDDPEMFRRRPRPEEDEESGGDDPEMFRRRPRPEHDEET
jgi:hypothetical protein